MRGRGKRKGGGGRRAVKEAEEKKTNCVEWEIRALWQDQKGIAITLRRTSFKSHRVQCGSLTIPLVMPNLHS